MGLDCSATSLQSIAMGNICDASGDRSIAMGQNAITMYKQTVALGSTPLATGPYVGSRSAHSGGLPGTDYAVDISKVYFVYRSPLGNSIEFVDATDYDGTSADFGSKIGLRYRSYDGSASELIFAAPAGSGGGGGSDLSGGIAWLNGNFSGAAQTGVAVPAAVQNLPAGTNVRVTLIGAGGGGGGGSATMGGGGGGGGGAMQYWLTTPITRTFNIGAGATAALAGQIGDWGGDTEDPTAKYKAGGGSGGYPGGTETSGAGGYGCGGIMAGGSWAGQFSNLCGGIGEIGTTFNSARAAAGGSGPLSYGGGGQGGGGRGGLINAAATMGGTSGAIKFEWFG
jgi:hypothetical protein